MNPFSSFDLSKPLLVDQEKSDDLLRFSEIILIPDEEAKSQEIINSFSNPNRFENTQQNRARWLYEQLLQKKFRKTIILEVLEKKKQTFSYYFTKEELLYRAIDYCNSLKEAIRIENQKSL